MSAVEGLAVGIVVARRLDGRVSNWHCIAELAAAHAVDPYDVVDAAVRIDPPPVSHVALRGKRGPDRRPRKIGSGRWQR